MVSLGVCDMVLDAVQKELVAYFLWKVLNAAKILIAPVNLKTVSWKEK